MLRDLLLLRLFRVCSRFALWVVLMFAPANGPGVYPTEGDRSHAMKRGAPDRAVVAGSKDWQVFSVSVDSRGMLYTHGFNGCTGELFYWGATCLGSVSRYCYKLAQWTPEARKEFARLVRIDKRDRRSRAS